MYGIRKCSNFILLHIVDKFSQQSYHRNQKKKKKLKIILIGKEQVKFSVLADDRILYIENPKYAFRKLLELMHEYSKGTRYETNAQKSLAFLYTNKEKSEGRIKETISFTRSTKIEILRNKFT